MKAMTLAVKPPLAPMEARLVRDHAAGDAGIALHVADRLAVEQGLADLYGASAGLLELDMIGVAGAV